MLKDYRQLAQSLKNQFQRKENWPDIKFDKDAKTILQKLDSVESVNDYSINIATGSDNHIILPSQYVLYAIKVKELALALNEHLSLINLAKDKFEAELLYNLDNNQEVLSKLEGLDPYSRTIALKPIYDKEFNFGAKSLINHRDEKYVYRSLSDFFTSIILQVINVPNASSSILGHFIFDLTNNPTVYNKLEKKYIEHFEFIIIESNINNFVYRVLTFLLSWKDLEPLLKYLEENDDERYFSIHYKNLKLVSVFRLSDQILNSEDVSQGGKERFFLDPITQVNGKYIYLSTEWTYDKNSRLDLQNFIKIIEDLYGFKLYKDQNKFVFTRKSNIFILENERFNPVAFIDSIESSALIYNPFLSRQFILSLTTKPFLILTGLSGSGKTKLAQAFSEWIIAEKSQLNLVPVGADWTNREPLLGYPNALEDGKYVLPESGVLQLLLRAKDDPERPYFLILDEMNLSHVERYFADFLSAIESKEEIKLHSGNQDWEADGYQIPSTLSIPKNFFIIGTVNIDETTYMFSPKVLDRANVIEFRVSNDELAQFLENPEDVDLESLRGQGAGMASDFVQIVTNKANSYREKEKLSKELLKFFEELSDVGAEFGYRTAFEINRFASLADKLSDNWKFNDIMDAAIAQKLLPKLHGSRRKLEKVLFKLGDLCHPDLEKGCEDLFKKHDNIDDEVIIQSKYPISFEKIVRMHKGLIENGFTSFAEA